MVDFGDVMSIKEFEDGVLWGAFTDYDGHGAFCDEFGNETAPGIRVIPSLWEHTEKLGTHVLWFNK